MHYLPETNGIDQMNRLEFLKYISLIPMGGIMTLNELNYLTSDMPQGERMPALFLGHGSPMNAIEDNEFVQGFRKLRDKLPTPRAIICISAHWETNTPQVTAMEQPETIHDFGGFPKALYQVEYPAPGSPSLAAETIAIAPEYSITADHQWGLDHGAWSVIKHLYPEANIPVIQLSLGRNLSPEKHFELAGQLKKLRNKGILIIGSGNMVHNLGLISWQHINTDNFAYDWTMEAAAKMKEYILQENFQALIHFRNQGEAFNLAIPTPEHYLPLLYAIGLKSKNEHIELFNDKAVAGSLMMTSVMIS